MIIQNGNIFTLDGTFSVGTIKVAKDKIAQLDMTPAYEAIDKTIGETMIDARGLYVLPGLVDIHTHGAVGVDFCEVKKEELCKLETYQAQNGVTTIFATTMTLPEEKLISIVEKTAEFRKEESNSVILGISMEGPFLSEKKRGAQEKNSIVDPDIAMFKKIQKKSNNLIYQVVVAPEEKGAMEFIREISKETIVSLGHSTADYETAKQGFLEGATHVTHLFNGMEPFLHREPGIVGAAFDNPDVFVELICDGVHVHPSVVRAMFSMFGGNRICMISDSLSATGMEDGKYTLGGQNIIKEGKIATLESGTIAGSVCNLYECLKIAVKDMKIPLEEAILACTKTPAKSLNVDDKCGILEEGRKADIIMVDKDLNIRYVLKNGKIIRENNSYEI